MSDNKDSKGQISDKELDKVAGGKAQGTSSISGSSRSSSSSYSSGSSSYSSGSSSYSSSPVS